MKEKEKEGKGEKNLHSGNLVLKGPAVAFNFHVSLAIVHGGPSWAQKAGKVSPTGRKALWVFPQVGGHIPCSPAEALLPGGGGAEEGVSCYGNRLPQSSPLHRKL